MLSIVASYAYSNSESNLLESNIACYIMADNLKHMWSIPEDNLEEAKYRE